MVSNYNNIVTYICMCNYVGDMTMTSSFAPMANYNPIAPRISSEQSQNLMNVDDTDSSFTTKP